jgi:hypothetical protein
VNGDFEQALAVLAAPEQPDGEPWTAARLREALEAYHAGHERICLDPNARNLRHTYVTAGGGQETLARAADAG